MTEPTPGPWKVVSTVFDEMWVYSKPDDKPVADCDFSCNTPEQVRANAHLIAAAPAMREALRLVVELGNQADTSITLDQVDEVIEAARAELEKMK